MKGRRANTAFFFLFVAILFLSGVHGFAQSSSTQSGFGQASFAQSSSGQASSGQSGGAFGRGLAEFRAGNYSSAAALFADAEAASPGATDALLYQAKSLVHLQDFAGAERALRGYVPSHPTSSDALYMLGFVLNRQNRPAESLAYYTQAAAITRPVADDLKVVGLDYVLLDDYADAIKWLEKAVAVDSTNKDAWYYLGRAYYTVARLEEARKAFLKVIDLAPRDVKAENNLGLIFESSGQPATAIEAYRKAIAWQEQIPHPSEQPYVNLGNLLLERGRAAEALALLEKAVALAPDNAFCHMTLGIGYRKAGQMVPALRELKRATELDPESAVAHYQLGRLYKGMHDMDRTQAELDRAQAKFDRAQAEFDRAQAEFDHAQAEFDRTAELKSRAAAAPSTVPNH
jgi:tetratricopeptide (TPR) repeat protein